MKINYVESEQEKHLDVIYSNFNIQTKDELKHLRQKFIDNILDLEEFSLIFTKLYLEEIVLMNTAEIRYDFLKLINNHYTELILNSESDKDYCNFIYNYREYMNLYINSLNENKENKE